MKTAVMQPYIFPYIGYFQLINAVDNFVFYNDVNFIKQGWVNRNRILVNNSDLLFTIPVTGISSNKKIKDTEIALNEYSKWVRKFLATIDNAYKKAPYFSVVNEIIQITLNNKYNSISDLSISSIKNVCEYLDIKPLFILSSHDFLETQSLEKADRLIAICRKLKSNEYINPIGGKELYEKEYFDRKGVKLNFLESKKIIYKQFNNNFIPWLSIIDVMMFNSPIIIKIFLYEYEHK